MFFYFSHGFISSVILLKSLCLKTLCVIFQKLHAFANTHNFFKSGILLYMLSGNLILWLNNLSRRNCHISTLGPLLNKSFNQYKSFNQFSTEVYEVIFWVFFIANRVVLFNLTHITFSKFIQTINHYQWNFWA